MLLALGLSACGGGGGSSVGGSGLSSLSGIVLDGYVGGATVCLDLNANGVCDAGEPSATSSGNGSYTISVPAGTSTVGKFLVAEVPVGAIDSVTGPVTTAYSMSTPVQSPSLISPLTSLVASQMQANSAVSMATAQTQAASAVGLPSNYDFTSDYIANNDTGAQNVATVIVGLLGNGNAGAALQNFQNIPSAPASAVATAGNAQATINFAIPASSGGSAITGYTVTSKPGRKTATGSASPITVTGLTNGTSYTFTVHATNTTGSGLESAISNAVTPIPDAPSTAAPAPTNTIVASILTTPVADIAATDFFPNWGQATLYAASSVGGVETAQYTNLNYQGIQLAANNNFSTAANVHLDIWTPNVTSLGFDLISAGPVQFQVNTNLTPGVWNSVDIPLSSFTGVDLTAVNQLSFTGVSPAAGGTIFVQNIYFWGSGAVATTVPGAPTINTATGGNTQATVSFSAPANNGNSAITGYTVTSNPAGGVDSNAGTLGLTHTITGLTNGTSYTFTVVATNAIGNSASSVQSNAVTPAAAVGLVTSTASSWALGGTADFNGVTSSLVTNQPAGGSQPNAAMAAIAAGSQYDGTTFLTLVNEEFCTTANPTVSVEAYAPVAGKIVELKLEQDGNPALNIEMRKLSVVGWNTYTFNCLTDSGLNSLVQPTAGYAESTVYNKASLFFDFDVTAGALAAETWYFDSVAYTPTAAVTYVPPAALAAPTTAATAPAHPILFSVLTTPAADMAGTIFFPNWGQSTAYTAITVGGVETAEYANLNYQGIQLAANTNVTTATHVHFDVWTDVTSLGFNLISINPGTLQFQVNNTLAAGVWNSVDIPLSSFTGVDLTAIDQFMFVGVTPASGGTIYVQNLYFW